jgi:hypothetical protein
VSSLLHLAVKLVAQSSKETSEDDDEASTSWRGRVPAEVEALINEKLGKLRALDAAAVAGTYAPDCMLNDRRLHAGFLSAQPAVDSMDARRKEKAETNLRIASELALSTVCCGLLAALRNVDVMLSTVRQSMINSDKWQLRCIHSSPPRSCSSRAAADVRLCVRAFVIREAALVVIQCHVEGRKRRNGPALRMGRIEEAQVLKLLSDSVVRARNTSSSPLSTTLQRMTNASRPRSGERPLVSCAMWFGGSRIPRRAST